MDVWKNTTLGDSDVTQKLVQLLIVTDGELEVTRDDTGLLVVTGSVACQFKDFGSEVFKDGSEVNRSTYSMLVLWNMEIGRKKKKRMTYQHQHAGRSCPYEANGEHVQRGTRDRPWTNAY